MMRALLSLGLESLIRQRVFADGQPERLSVGGEAAFY